MTMTQQNPLTLPNHREVRVAGRRAFDLFYAVRNAGHAAAGARHGVAQEGVIDDYLESLVSSYQRLCSPEFGWTSWADDAGGESRDVAVLDLGRNLLGAANAFGTAKPYLALSCRPHESTAEAARRRRAATVAHEIVHMLQFETPAWRYWPEQNRWGTGDPNWWLHEAVALATEALIEPDSPGWYSWLWDWATMPERSLEWDSSGCFAAPLLIYLMQSLNSRFGSDLYSIRAADVPGMRAASMLAWLIETREKRSFASATARQCVFADYCVDAGVLGIIHDSVLDPHIAAIAGPRVRTDVFEAYPVKDACQDKPIDHLACRYFGFRPNPCGSRLEITMTPDDSVRQRLLRGELVVVSHDLAIRNRISLVPTITGIFKAVVDGFSMKNVDHALLVIINCGYGDGWAECDGIRFRINASLV